MRIIGVDFDETIACYKFPLSHDEVPGSIDALKEFASLGARLILNTNRSGPLLWWAKNWCEARGIVFHDADWPWSRKIYADKFIDDRGWGCPTILGPNGKPCVDWSIVHPQVTAYLKSSN